MEPRRSDNTRTPQEPSALQQFTRLIILLLFIVVAYIMVSVLWKEPVIAPEQTQITGNAPTEEIIVDEEVIEELPPTAEEIEALEAEQEREIAEQERLERASFEAGYYLEEQYRTAVDSEWTIMPSSAAQGDVILVRHKEEKDIIFDEKTYTLQEFGTGYYAYIPIRRNLKPGEYSIGDQLLTVEEKQFATQHLEVTEQMESMRRDTDRIAADQIKVNQARSQSETAFLFPPDAEFLQPIEGRLTTPFGFTRYVNGNLSGSHMAIDLAAPEGTPIMATNEGVVVLSDELYLAGNSVYIDHGMGLFSQYGHLYELHVEEGDWVKQGDIIGLVGTTGFSTGPHLHFTFWAHNVPVNPDLFFGKTPFHWLE